MMRRLCRTVAVAAAVLLAGTRAGLPATDDPIVHVVVHVMLNVPHAPAGAHGPWYCGPGHAFRLTPIPAALIRQYVGVLRREGTVHDALGLGTWTVGSAPNADVAFEEGDHIEVVTRLSRARRFLAPMLHRMRIELDQQEALGEIVGGAYGTPAQTRTRITVVVPFADAGYARLAQLHRIFGDRGRGGATQIAGPQGVVVDTGATSAARARIERDLRAAGFVATEEPETFVTDDAPPCTAGAG
jgi:hypothetical protein